MKPEDFQDLELTIPGEEEKPNGGQAPALAPLPLVEGDPQEAKVELPAVVENPNIPHAKQRFATLLQQGIPKPEIKALLGLGDQAYELYRSDPEVKAALARLQAEASHRTAMLRHELDLEQRKSLELLRDIRDNSAVPWRERMAAAQDLLDRGGYLNKQGAQQERAPALLITEEQLQSAIITAVHTLPGNGKEESD